MPISTYKLVAHFAKLPEYRVHVVLPADGELTRRIRACGIEPAVIPFNRLRSLRRFGEFLRFAASYPRAFLKLCSFLGKNDIALIHFSDIIDMPFFACGRLGRAKTVAHLRHCIESRCGRFLFGLLSSLFVDAVVCISEATFRFSGLDRRRARIVYNPGPDASIFDPARPFPPVRGLPENGNIIVTIGKFLQVKGHEHFVAMARRVEAASPGTCFYVIIGNKLPAHERYYERILRLIADSGVGDRIVVLGQLPHETVPAVLARSTVYVHLPNWQEGLGGSVLEAMAMKVPVVAFDSGGVGECFTSSESGFLVPQFDVREASDRVVQLLRDESLRKKMGAAARRELLSKFSYERHCSEIRITYGAVLNPSAPPQAPETSIGSRF